MKAMKTNNLFDIRNIAISLALFLVIALADGLVFGLPLRTSIAIALGLTCAHFCTLFLMGGRVRYGCFLLFLTGVILLAIFWWMVGGA